MRSKFVKYQMVMKILIRVLSTDIRTVEELEVTK